MERTSSSLASAKGWADLSAKMMAVFKPDVPPVSALLLLLSLMGNVVLEGVLFPASRSSAGKAGVVFQNWCNVGNFCINIARNVWIITHVARVHPPQMRRAFGLGSLTYHATLGNASPLILNLASLTAVAYFFKVMAFSHEGHCDIDPLSGVTSARTEEECDKIVKRGTWARIDLRLLDNGTQIQHGVCVGSAWASTQATCEFDATVGTWIPAEMTPSSYTLFAIQALNYPIAWLTCTAVENSFVQIRWVALQGQLFCLLLLGSSLYLHILYITNENFNPQFASLRILSLASFILMRIAAYTFWAFKRDAPSKTYCQEVREDVRGMRFLPAEEREALKAEYEKSRRTFGAFGGDGELVSQTGRSVSEVHDAKLSGPVDESSAMDNPLKGQAFQLDGAVDT